MNHHVHIPNMCTINFCADDGMADQTFCRGFFFFQHYVGGIAGFRTWPTGLRKRETVVNSRGESFIFVKLCTVLYDENFPPQISHFFSSTQ